MNLFDYPMTAGFVLRALLLLFAWGMYFVLTGRPGSHAGWVGLLQALRLVRKDPEEESSVPLYSKTKVLVVRTAEGKTPEPEVETAPDYTLVIDRSRLLFKVAGVLVLLELCRFGFMSYRQYDPYFLYGPDTENLSSPSDHPLLPPPIPGAGGGGAIQATVGPQHGPNHISRQPGSTGSAPDIFAPGNGVQGTPTPPPRSTNPFANPPPKNSD